VERTTHSTEDNTMSPKKRRGTLSVEASRRIGYGRAGTPVLFTLLAHSRRIAEHVWCARTGERVAGIVEVSPTGIIPENVRWADA